MDLQHFQLPEHFLGDLAAAGAFGLLVVFLTIIGLKLIDWSLRKVCFEKCLNEGNIAVGIVVASIILGIFYAVANVVVAILT